ncbi:hypothetical protein JEQ17_21390 [Streptomyces liliifuscus]|uniref:RNA polymerase sigma-70 region 2 domain-containing protein n=1 Tax=Streptomyces liliifuscus TaxID=2797636 RepID=A0A7T7RHJ7_9ACTN|nr:hypothetical protein JEQ17_21390 [Streptomyces liliifuscus]
MPERAAGPGRWASRAAPPRADAAGFALFHEENFYAVLGFVTRRTSRPQVAADLTADFFVPALETAGQYDPKRGAPYAWLYGIARDGGSHHCRGDRADTGRLARVRATARSGRRRTGWCGRPRPAACRGGRRSRPPRRRTSAGAHTYERAPHLKWGPFAVIRSQTSYVIGGAGATVRTGVISRTGTDCRTGTRIRSPSRSRRRRRAAGS